MELIDSNYKTHAYTFYDAWCTKSRIVRMVKSSKTEIGSACSTYGSEEMFIRVFLWEKLTEGVHLEDPGVDGRIILKWIFEKWNGVAWTGSTWLRIGTVEGIF
jgi:hypothetical protein